MKFGTLVAVLTALSAIPAFAEAEPTCASLPASQQSVWSAFNAYVKSGADRDAMIYIGALQQYQVDLEQYGDQTDSDFGNNNSVDIFESRGRALCSPNGFRTLDKWLKNEDPTAVKFVLFYSAIAFVDGAAAEDLVEWQTLLKRKYPTLIEKIQRENRAFFKAHPIIWLGT